MSRILVMSSPARGLLYPIIETLVTLRDRGSQVHVITLSGEMDMVRGLGLDASPLPPAIDDALPGDWNGDRGRSVTALTDRLLARIDDEFDHLEAAIASVRPDMVLTDVVATGAQCAAEASGLPWAVWSPTFLPLFSTDGPPIGLGLRPRDSRLARLRDATLARLARRMWDVAFLRKFNHLRARRGLPRLAHCDEILRRAPLIISLCGPPLERRRRDWPDTVALVGPSLWAPRQAVDARIAAIDDPVALVTCSTELQADDLLASTAMAALGDTGLHTVVTTGALEPERFGSRPDATVVRFVPHEQVLDSAAVVITHGGMGITQKALARGIPLVIVPFGRDQRDIATRVEAAGSGVRLDPRTLTPDTLRAAVSAATALRRRESGAAFASATGSALRAAVHIETTMAAGGDREPIDRRGESHIRRPSRLE